MEPSEDLNASTFQTYIYLVKVGKPVGPRDVMRGANLSSPSVAYRNLQKLMETLLYWRLAKIEEREALAKYGDAFLKYKQAVPRFIPHLRRHQIKNVQNHSITLETKPKPL